MVNAKTSKLLLTAVLVAATTLVGFAVTSHHAKAAAPSTIPIKPVSFDAVYVVNGGDGETSSISVINAETNTLAATIRLTDAMWPHHISLSADGRRMLVAVPGMDMSAGHEGGQPDMPGAVMLLNARTGATIKSVVTPVMNHNAIFSPNGREVWTSQMMAPGSVLALDARTLRPRQEIPVGGDPAEVTFAPDGRYGFVANGGSDSVTVVNTRTKRVVKTIAVGDDPVGAWQGSNGFAYVDNEAGETISVIDRRRLSVRFTYDLGFMPGMAQLGPDGHLWVTDADNGRVVLYSPTRDRRLHETPTGNGAHGIAFSADGRTAYITNQLANTVSAIDIRTRTLKKTINVGSKPNGLVFRAG
jgi:YVTN family beta-propeller protein